MAFLKIRLAQRQQENKKSHVYVKGVLLPKLEIEKKAARCYVPLAEQYALEKCETPKGILIITPTSDCYMRCVKTRDLPWIYFLRQLPSIRNLNMLIDMPPQTLRAIMPAVCPGAPLAISDQMEQIVHHLSATMPVKRDEDIYSVLRHIVGLDYASPTTEILKLTVYLLSNKLLGYRVDSYSSAMVICDELLKWFQMGDNYLLLKAILSHRLPTIEAFAEGIFASALEVEDRQMLRIFLDSGMNPNITIIDREDNWEHTALQFATRRHGLSLVKLLLEFEVDVDLTSRGNPSTPLQIAARNGNIEIAQSLISRGATVDRFNKWESSPLQNAAMGGNTELASILLDHGADINAQSRNYGCPLECAIRARAIGLVEMLLERGADIDCRPQTCVNTPLQSAAMIDDHEMVQRLLQRGADANAPAAKWCGKTALQWAAMNGNFNLCQVLIKAGADLNAAPAVGIIGTTTLVAAVSSNNYQLVELLLQYGAEVNDERSGKTALEIAARLNDTAIMRLLLSAKANPRLGTPVLFAAKNQNSVLISTLLQSGADINKMDRVGRSALSIAVEKNDLSLVQFLLGASANPNPVSMVGAARLGNLDMIEILLRAGADCNQPQPEFFDRLNALQAAAAKGNIKVVRHLLAAGAELNCPAAGNRGRTALQAAVKSGDLELIQFMIDQGADLSSPAAEFGGATALQEAVSSSDRGLVRILLAAGANADDAPSDTGSTSLQRAAAKGDDDLIRLLLEYGADINRPAAHHGGRTALQAAAGGGHYHMVQLLLARGANANAPASRHHGETALQAAAEKGYLHIAEVLLDKGASVNAHGSETGGYTALESAVASGRIDMLKLLLNAGADITSDIGRSQLTSALSLATAMGHNAAAKFLKYHQIC